MYTVSGRQENGVTDNWYSEEHATLGDRLAAAREAAGMNQAKLAQRLGVRKSTLVGWENDSAEPRANQVQMLTALLSVSLRWLLTGVGQDVAPPDAIEPLADHSLKVALSEVRAVRADVVRTSDRLARLEKSLRLQISESAKTYE